MTVGGEVVGGEWSVFDRDSNERQDDFAFLTHRRAVDWATSNDMRVWDIISFDGKKVE